MTSNWIEGWIVTLSSSSVANKSFAREINEEGNLTGEIKVYDYKNNKNIIPEVILNLGRNLYCDFGFCKKDVFIDKVYKNYLTWNGPFWLDVDSKEILNVKKLDFNFFKYRVFSGNYVNSDLGKLCVINGELRVLCNLLSSYYIPLFKVQYFIFKVFNKLKLRNLFIPIYFNRETSNKNKAKIIYFTLRKRFSSSWLKTTIILKFLYFQTKKFPIIYISMKLKEYFYISESTKISKMESTL